MREVAALCGVEQKTVHGWAAQGVLPHFRTPGGHLRFAGAAVAELVESGRGPRAARSRGPEIVVIVAADAKSSLRAARALGGIRVVWFGDAPIPRPPGVEVVRTSRALRALLAAGDGHRRDSKRR